MLSHTLHLSNHRLAGEENGQINNYSKRDKSYNRQQQRGEGTSQRSKFRKGSGIFEPSLEGGGQ